MRILFLTQDDPLYILPFFDEFLRNYAHEFEIALIASSRTMGGRARSKMLKELIQLYGILGTTKLVARLCTSRFFGLFPKVGGTPRYHTLAQACHAFGVPLSKIGNPNDPKFIQTVRRTAPDILVSVACPYILKSPLLSIAPRGAINIHHSPLPRYKGMMPTFWQLFHGEKTVGLTIHYMVARVDEGMALLQESQEIRPEESLDQLIKRCKRRGAHCMAEVLRKIESGEAEAVALDHSRGSYFSFPTGAEIREFRKRGLRAI